VAGAGLFAVLQPTDRHERGVNVIRIRMHSLVVLLFAVLLTVVLPRNMNARAEAPGGAAASVKSFVGRWDLTIQSPGRELPSWIEVSDEQGHAKVVMVGVSDHATPLAKAEVTGGELQFLSPKGEEGFPEDMQFKGKLVSGKLEGTVTGSSGKSWPWTGRRAPSLARHAPPKWGKPTPLFDGKNFDGWKFADPARKGVWKIENGTMVKDGSGSDIVTTSKFEDFKLHLEFNCGPMSNSGVYLRGRYEVQIETDSVSEPPSHHTGGVYGFLAPHPELPRKPGAWRTFDITLVGRTITVVEDGQTVINHQEIPGITGGALDSHEGMPGPIYLQGSEKGRVEFRNIVITPAK
jgi:3-keto-disaccharide hydrolase